MSRSVLITAGSRAIGRAIADEFTALEDWVAVAYCDGDPPDGPLGVRYDVADGSQVEAALNEVEDAHGSVEVLVANACDSPDSSLERSEGDGASDVSISVATACRVAKRAATRMTLTSGGRIILVAPAVAVLRDPDQIRYTASRRELIRSAQALALEFGSRGITVNVVAPGLIETEAVQELSVETRSQLVDKIPTQRMTQPQEIAAAVAFLASPEASSITGAVIPVDGGANMRQ